MEENIDNTHDIDIPDRLPRLDWGSHSENSHRACAMEAAAWLAGEPWSDQPRSVHPAIARVARVVNDRVSDEVRQSLWPLIIASLDSKRAGHPVLSLRLERCATRALVSARNQGELRQAWITVLDSHARLFGPRSVTAPATRLKSLSTHLQPR